MGGGPHVCLFQWDNRTDAQLGAQAELMVENQKLCASLPNCTYYKTQAKEERPVYWEKVFQTNALLKAHPECDLVVYLDSDAVIRRPHLRFLDAMRPEQHFLASDDTAFDPAALFLRPKPFNAGVWAVRNTVEGRDIMNDWESLYPSTRWRRDGDKWSCPGCSWAGAAYEQGAFVNILRDRPDQVHLTSAARLNNMHCLDPRHAVAADVCHFMGDRKRDIREFLARREPQAPP
jgi:hypothetical protein